MMDELDFDGLAITNIYKLRQNMKKLNEDQVKDAYVSFAVKSARYTADLTLSYETYIAAQKEQLTEAARLLNLARHHLLKLEAENLELKDDLASIYAACSLDEDSLDNIDWWY